MGIQTMDHLLLVKAMALLDIRSKIWIAVSNKNFSNQFFGIWKYPCHLKLDVHIQAISLLEFGM